MIRITNIDDTEYKKSSSSRIVRFLNELYPLSIETSKDTFRFYKMTKQSKEDIIEEYIYITELFKRFVHLTNICIEEHKINDLKSHLLSAAFALEVDLTKIPEKIDD